MLLKNNFRNIKYAIRHFWGRIYGCVGVSFNLLCNSEYIIEKMGSIYRKSPSVPAYIE